MRGHDHIKTMRLQGAVPRIIFVDTVQCEFKCWRDWHINTPHMAQVEVEPTDLVSGLDLRFAVGLSVVVNGDDLDRVEAVGRAFGRVGAGRVITSTVARAGRAYDVVRLTDSAA